MLSPLEPQFKSYLTRLFWLLATAIAIVVTLVVLVDPYALYGVMNSSFNTIKPSLSRYQSEIKLQRAIRSNPEFIILGNSRAEIGFDPSSPAFGEAAGRGFNLAVPGTGINTSISQINGLAAVGITPKTIVIGAEFMDFLMNSTTLSDEKTIAPTPATLNRSTLWWQFDALFSMESLKDVARTILIQNNEEVATLSSNGFNPLNEYKVYVHDDGYHKIFEQRALEIATMLSRKSKVALSSGDLKLLRTLLTAATKNNADVKLLIYPYHAQILAMIEHAGLWNLFELWKSQLAGEVAALKRANPEIKLTLYDFSGFGPITCEHIPLKSEKGRSDTQWYWEAGHFKKKLGDVVIQKMLQRSELNLESDFGAVLDASVLSANALRIARERVQCIAVQPDLFENSKRLLKK